MSNYIIVKHNLKSFDKKIKVSGDKSLSIRWVLFSSLAHGTSIAHNLLLSEETCTLSLDRHAIRFKILRSEFVLITTTSPTLYFLDFHIKTYVFGLNRGSMLKPFTLKSLGIIEHGHY